MKCVNRMERFIECLCVRLFFFLVKYLRAFFSFSHPVDLGTIHSTVKSICLILANWHQSNREPHKHTPTHTHTHTFISPGVKWTFACFSFGPMQMICSTKTSSQIFFLNILIFHININIFQIHRGEKKCGENKNQKQQTTNKRPIVRGGRVGWNRKKTATVVQHIRWIKITERSIKP